MQIFKFLMIKFQLLACCGQNLMKNKISKINSRIRLNQVKQEKRNSINGKKVIYYFYLSIVLNKKQKEFGPNYYKFHLRHVILNYFQSPRLLQIVRPYYLPQHIFRLHQFQKKLFQYQLIDNLMKTIIIAILILGIAFGLQIKVGSQVQITQSRSVTLTCEAAKGHVTYEGINLPNGVRVYNDKIEIFDDRRVEKGYYPIKLRANDASGASDERIIILVIRDQSGAQATVSAGNIRGTTNSGAASSTSPASATVQLPQPDAGVSALLDSLQVPATSDAGSSPATSGSGSSPAPSADGSYPALQFPTGSGIPSGPNPTTLLIGSNQAPRTAAVRNQITVDDVKFRAVFERKLNAGKALANLLSIVKQATANKNAAQEQTAKRQSLYDDTLNKQRDAQAAVTKAEGDVARVKQAITLLTTNINDVNKKIADNQAAEKDLKNQINAANQGVQTAQRQLNNINYDLGANQKDTNDVNDAKSSKQNECSAYNAEATKAANERDAQNAQLNDVDYKLKAAKDKVDADAQKVKDLQDQLNAAVAALDASQKAANDLAGQKSALTNSVNDLNKRVEDLTARQNKCQSEVDAFTNRINKLKDDAYKLQQKKNQIEGEVKILNDKINGLTAEADKYPAQNANYNNQLAQLNKNLNYLRNQLPIFQRLLNDAYNNGNSANDAVRLAKQNLDAAIARYNSQKKIEQTAILNIEAARTESQQADAAANALLRDGAGVLPFAAAPSDSGAAGTNNEPVSIKSWTDFVLAGYGAGVKPLFIGDLKTLYPFRLPGQAPADATTSPAANAPGTGECAVANPRALSGYVIQVGSDSFRVLGDGGAPLRVTYAGCTAAYANTADYSIKVGDVVVIKGLPSGAQDFKATQIACVSQ